MKIQHSAFIIQRYLCARCLFLAGLLLAKADSLADAVAEVVELGPAGHAAALHLDLGDLGRVERELALNPFTRHDAADGEHLATAAARATDDSAAENLDALVFPFQNSCVDIDRIAHGELRDLSFEAGFFNEFE